MIIDINGVRYHVKVIGDGDPLVLLHGFTGSGENWDPFVAQWSAHFKLIIIDILGHGKTAVPTNSERYTMEHVVEDLKGILKALSVKKANLLGYSMGGRLALSFAVTYPHMVHSLLLESSSPGLKNEAERSARVDSDERLAAWIIQEGIESFVEYWESIPLFASQKSLPTEKQQEIRNQRLRNSEIGLANSLLGMGTGKQPSWWGKLHTLQIPVWLLTGDGDTKFCKIALEMEKRLPNSRNMVVTNCGHAIHVEQPEIFGKMVMEYLIDSNNL